ncbi:hypothetical protein HPB49_015333 [Dermacentor silvarum]|uniref:Uncharacterized protein n=1 Tax=Dermacentor silvarum TaxID=543639 RepID=A0ACB8E0Q9_DERSI|nr:hypothetical protein HPB49_015333 [Dermacentor silvarum]
MGQSFVSSIQRLSIGGPETTPLAAPSPTTTAVRLLRWPSTQGQSCRRNHQSRGLVHRHLEPVDGDAIPPVLLQYHAQYLYVLDQSRDLVHRHLEPVDGDAVPPVLLQYHAQYSYVLDVSQQVPCFLAAQLAVEAVADLAPLLTFQCRGVSFDLPFELRYAPSQLVVVTLALPPVHDRNRLAEGARWVDRDLERRVRDRDLLARR